MRRVNTTAEALEQVVGARRRTMLMKSVDELDDETRRVIAAAPIAAFGYRDDDRHPYTTFVGGSPGFTQVEAPTRIRLALPVTERRAALGGGASLLFLLPGVGETLRVNGVIVANDDGGVALELQEAFVHCARCILRSRLWDTAAEHTLASSPGERAGGLGPFADPEVATFVASSPFLVITSWDSGGASDTSPRGDDPGFLHILDSNTLAIPDRRGNTRTDTFHNLLECDEVSLAAVLPGNADVLHLSGRAYVTDDGDLVSTMAVPGDSRPPKAALVIRIDGAAIEPCAPLHEAKLWDPASRVDTSLVPDLMALSVKHLAASKAKGASASLAKVASKALARAPRLLRRGVDRGYKKELADEGYEERT